MAGRAVATRALDDGVGGIEGVMVVRASDVNDDMTTRARTVLTRDIETPLPAL